MFDRREVLGIGIVAGIGALVTHALAQEGGPGAGGGSPGEIGAATPNPPAAEGSRGYAASPIHLAHPLEFRLDSDYRPDLSDAAARSLVVAVREFLEAEHPGGLTMIFWDRHPTRMPFLARHLELIVEHLFRGIAENVTTRAVDPILVLALLYNESRFHPTVVSPAGAAGMAQFMPDTAREYGLVPTSRSDLWSAYRDARAAYRRSLDERQKAFRARHGGIAFSADGAVDRAVATGSLEVLADYRALRDEKDPSSDALKTYIRAIEEGFARYDFFGSGREALEALDARVGYRPVAETVRYLARSCESFQGLSTTAVASYNAGLDAVRVDDSRSILSRFGALPTNKETVRYVQRIVATYSAIKYRLFVVGGGSAAAG